MILDDDDIDDDDIDPSMRPIDHGNRIVATSSLVIIVVVGPTISTPEE